MLQIINAILPTDLTKATDEVVKSCQHTSMGNFFCNIRKWLAQERMKMQLKKSQKDVRAGKYVKLNSLADID